MKGLLKFVCFINSDRTVTTADVGVPAWTLQRRRRAARLANMNSNIHISVITPVSPEISSDESITTFPATSTDASAPIDFTRDFPEFDSFDPTDFVI